MQDHQIFRNREQGVALYLEASEDVEDEYGEDEADDGDDAADVCDDGEREAVCGREGRGVEVHQHSEVGEVLALAADVGDVATHDAAALLRPQTGRR